MSSVEDTKRQIEVMQAYVDGKHIELRDCICGDWAVPTHALSWNWAEFDYRIAPPKKVEMWQWILKSRSDQTPFITTDFFDSDSAVQKAYGANAKIVQRADWTQIEVEAENGKD